MELARLLRRRPGISVADAAAGLGLAANTVSTLARQIVDAGLVERVIPQYNSVSDEIPPEARPGVEHVGFREFRRTGFEFDCEGPEFTRRKNRPVNR
nr:MarR family transcriptional regulator [Rhodococcus sp. WMMA185]